MYQKRATFILAMVFLGVVPAGSIARAAGCDSCHFRPGKCPTLTDSEFFGYHPTVWQLWPGPQDPMTTYPGTTMSQPATVKEILLRNGIKPPSASTYTATPSH
jgi:hypothetical protein